MICSAVRFFVTSIYFDPLNLFFLNLYPKCSIEENIINTNTGHNQPVFIKAAYNCKTIDIAMPFFMQISGIVFMSPLKMVSKTMNKRGNIALFYFAAPSSAAVLTFYKISCFFHFTTHLAYRINALQKAFL